VFTAAAILTLGLAIGANTAIYELLDAVVFRTLFPELAAQQEAAGLFATGDYPGHAAILRGRGPAHTVNAVIVTANYFRVLASAVGQSITMNKAAFTIIGIAPPEFTVEAPANTPDLWLPIGLTPELLNSDWRNAPKTRLSLMARLRPGVPQPTPSANRKRPGARISIPPAES